MTLFPIPHALKILAFLAVALIFSGCRSVHDSIKNPVPGRAHTQEYKFRVNTLTAERIHRKKGTENYDYGIDPEKAKSCILSERGDMFTSDGHGSIPIDIIVKPLINQRKELENIEINSLSDYLFRFTLFQFPRFSKEEMEFVIICKLGDNPTKEGSIVISRSVFVSAWPVGLVVGTLSSRNGWTPFTKDGHFHLFEGNKDFANAVANVVQQFDDQTIMLEYNRLHGTSFELKITEN